MVGRQRVERARSFISCGVPPGLSPSPHPPFPPSFLPSFPFPHPVSPPLSHFLSDLRLSWFSRRMMRTLEFHRRAARRDLRLRAGGTRPGLLLPLSTGVSFPHGPPPAWGQHGGPGQKGVAAQALPLPCPLPPRPPIRSRLLLLPLLSQRHKRSALSQSRGEGERLVKPFRLRHNLPGRLKAGVPTRVL